MTKVKTFLIGVLAFLSSAAAQAPTHLTVDDGRLVRVEGVINQEILTQAAEVRALVAKSHAPLYVSINSPGGDVVAGLVFVNALREAHAAGVQVNCFVTDFAASMAFFVLSQCDLRYATKFSMLLFHPARSGMEGSFTADELRSSAEALHQLEAPLIEEMIRATGMDRAVFMRNYRAETLWPAAGLLLYAPFFLTIVDGYDGYDREEGTDE